MLSRKAPGEIASLERSPVLRMTRRYLQGATAHVKLKTTVSTTPLPRGKERCVKNSSMSSQGLTGLPFLSRLLYGKCMSAYILAPHRSCLSLAQWVSLRAQTDIQLRCLYIVPHPLKITVARLNPYPRTPRLRLLPCASVPNLDVEMVRYRCTSSTSIAGARPLP